MDCSKKNFYLAKDVRKKLCTLCNSNYKVEKKAKLISGYVLGKDRRESN